MRRKTDQIKMGALKNIAVVGGSYVGWNTAAGLARIVPPEYKVLLIEPHAQLHHLFVFPRFCAIPGYERKAFIPYSRIFSGIPGGERHASVQARVKSVSASDLLVNKTASSELTKIPYEYLILATGTRLAQPSNMPYDDKESSIAYIQYHQKAVQRANSIVIVGGGAVGVQTATDIKEWYPNKEVTVVQSRQQLMPAFHEKVHEELKNRFDELDIRMITGARAVIPDTGFPADGRRFDVALTNGETVPADLVIQATGQKPNSEILASLPQSSPSESHINSTNKFIRVKPTLQLADPKYPNIFALGDVADTGAQKSVKAAVPQMETVFSNIQSLIQGQEAKATFTPVRPGIHLSLGKSRHAVFRNDPINPDREPTVIHHYDGEEDLGVSILWEKLGWTAGDAEKA